MHFRQISVSFESQAGSKLTGNLFNQCALKRAFEWCATCTTDPKICRDISKMATHLTGVSIKILHIKRGDQGCSSKEHKICGSVLSTDVFVQMQKVQCCHLFDFVITIDDIGMGNIMLGAQNLRLC